MKGWSKIKNFFIKIFKINKEPKKETLFINRQLGHYAKDFQFLSVQDYEVAYLERGEGSDTILFLHGMTEDALNWFYTMEYLFIKSASFKLLAIDLPGFGQTKTPDNFKISIDKYVEVVLGFLEEKNIESVTFIGHSLGGQTAANFAYLYPHKVKQLILVDAAGIRRFGSMAAGFFQALPIPGKLLKQFAFFDWFKMMGSETLLKDKKYFQKMMYEIAMTRKNSLTEFFIDRSYQHLLEGGLNRVNAIKEAMDAMLESQFYIDEKLSTLSCPVDFIWGEDDQMIPVKYGYQGYDMIKHDKKKFYVFRKTGHYPLLERPRDFSETVFKFLMLRREQ